jgi:dTDP-4-dehydrorhamnose 3,5-epimerase-like enzyme
MSNLQPYLIEFPKIGDYTQGYISISQGNSMPIDIKRVYWTYYTPEEIIRGNHAHHELEQILFAAAGRITVETETIDGNSDSFTLDRPNLGLFIPKLCWRSMQYSHNAVQICLASVEYDEKDYIREYDNFKALQATWNGTK